MIEIWKDVKGYEGHYKVSNTGKVYSLKTEMMLSQQQQGHQYFVVQLWKNSKPKGKMVHRLVAEAFIPNPENKPEVNHIDQNPQNNNANNLEWVTRSENYRAYRNSEKFKEAYQRQLEYINTTALPYKLFGKKLKDCTEEEIHIYRRLKKKEYRERNKTK